MAMRRSAVTVLSSLQHAAGPELLAEASPQRCVDSMGRCPWLCRHPAFGQHVLQSAQRVNHLQDG